MDNPANVSPMSLTDIANLLDAKVDKILSQQKEEAAKRNAVADKRDADLRKEMGGLREYMKERETRQSQWMVTIAIGTIVAMGFLFDLLGAPTVSPIIINKPPAIQAAPPVTGQ